MPPRPQPPRTTLLLEFSCASLYRYQCYAKSSLNSTPPSRAQWFLKSRRAHRTRFASTIAPATVVNAVKTIPPANRELYGALEELQKEAGIYTSLSQLQLALRGLESEHAVTRIALSSRHKLQGARRLIRVLLADPLSAETPWEKRLLEVEDADDRALLIRYDEKTDYDQKHPLLRTLTIPAVTLQKHNLEILLQRVASNDETNVRSLHTYLVPCLEVASSSTTRYSVIRYPVHKALVYGEGLLDISTYEAITSAKDEEKDMVRGILNTPWSNLHQNGGTTVIAPINVDRAEAAIQTFRESLGNSVEYEHAWFDSGLPRLSNWFLKGSASTSAALRPTIHRLINLILVTTENRILVEEAERLQQAASIAILPATRSNLSRLLSTWSENAHTELRDQLDLAFDSRAWRRLAWWKLPWRVDDVAMLFAEVLHRSWLTDAEKELIWVAGRVEEAGLYIPQRSKSLIQTDLARGGKDEPIQVRQGAIFSSTVPLPSITSLFPSTAASEPEPLSAMPLKPYPQTLTQARKALVITTTPTVQAIAQSLLLHSLSISFLTSSLSALMYFSISTTSIYESGTIAAFGLVYSLRRLQTQWEEVRTSWEEHLREQGRMMLRMIEKHWRGIIGEGGKPHIDQDDVVERQRAKDAVARVRSALDAMDDKKP